MAAGTSNDDLTTDHGCLATGKWSWTVADSTGRWTNPQQAVKPVRYHIPTSSTDPRNDGHSVLRSRLKMRGKGETLTVRYESEEGKDFQLLGWSVPYTVETSD